MRIKWRSIEHLRQVFQPAARQTWRTSLLVRLRISGCCLQLPIGEEGKTKKGKDPDKPKKPAGGAYGHLV